jgi:hypothetical protein
MIQGTTSATTRNYKSGMHFLEATTYHLVALHSPTWQCLRSGTMGSALTCSSLAVPWSALLYPHQGQDLKPTVIVDV